MDDLSRTVARQIIDRVGGPGQPPEYGFQYFTAGLDPYLRVIGDEYLDDFVGHGGSTFKLVVGPFGGGKTHLLYSIRELAWKSNYATSYIELSQNSTPFHKLELVYGSIVQNVASPLPPEELLEGQSKGIESLLTTALERERTQLEASGLTGSDLDEALDAWVGGFGRFDSVSYQRAIRAAYAALRAEREDEFETVCQWLRGEGYVPASHRKLGILQRIDKSTAFSMIRSLVQLVRALGYAGLVVLLDEAEPNSSLNTRQRETVLSNLRELIDEVGRSDLKYSMFVYAVPDEHFLEGRGLTYRALVQRLQTTFSRSNPTGVKILLDEIWADPISTLVEIGHKLAKILEVANQASLDPAAIESTVQRIADESYEQRFGDIGYRRQFVQNVIVALNAMVPR